MKRLLIILFALIAFTSFLGYVHYQKQNEDKSRYEFNTTRGITKKNDGILIEDVPLIQQKPELDRGCEVTSLAMLLQHAGVDVEKIELAEKIKKVDTPYKNENGTYYYGNPNDGFVGNIYTFDKMGYGVYHGPVTDLAERYLPGRIVDFSGSNFNEVLGKIKNGKPVWVIINSEFRALPESEFRTWNTPSGKVKITWKEHSVVITGYDREHVYVNDPLNKEKNRKLKLNDFEEAWKQMGSQAITYKN
ncbi:C39 family peptidase [Fictibacillus nanhaiensis]|uniref:C39 family peptidase n=1 Tax=Fictibacillus nanhaiensis TaxID=742169 RepID=UPI00296FFCD1